MLSGIYSLMIICTYIFTQINTNKILTGHGKIESIRQHS
jgi:L-lactate permease